MDARGKSLRTNFQASSPICTKDIRRSSIGIHKQSYLFHLRLRSYPREAALRAKVSQRYLQNGAKRKLLFLSIQLSENSVLLDMIENHVFRNNFRYRIETMRISIVLRAKVICFEVLLAAQARGLLTRKRLKRFPRRINNMLHSTLDVPNYMWESVEKVLRGLKKSLETALLISSTSRRPILAMSLHLYPVLHIHYACSNRLLFHLDLDVETTTWAFAAFHRKLSTIDHQNFLSCSFTLEQKASQWDYESIRMLWTMWRGCGCGIIAHSSAQKQSEKSRKRVVGFIKWKEWTWTHPISFKATVDRLRIQKVICSYVPYCKLTNYASVCVA